MSAVIDDSSETSRAAARLLLEKGTQLDYHYGLNGSIEFARSGMHPATPLHQIRFELYLWDVRNTRDPRWMPDSELTLKVHPQSPFEWGFQTIERGLSGKFESMEMLILRPQQNGYEPRLNKYSSIQVPPLRHAGHSLFPYDEMQQHYLNSLAQILEKFRAGSQRASQEL